MIHNNEVLGKTIDVISKFTDLYIDAMFYIVQNVYGKIIVYVDSKEEDIVINLKKHLADAIDVWLRTCERYEDNYFARIEIEEWKKENTPIKNRIWVFEKYITNVYWDAKRKRKKKWKERRERKIGGEGREALLQTSCIMSRLLPQPQSAASQLGFCPRQTSSCLTFGL